MRKVVKKIAVCGAAVPSTVMMLRTSIGSG